MRRLAWTFAARIGGKYQIRLMGSNYVDNLVEQNKMLSLELPFFALFKLQ